MSTCAHSNTDWAYITDMFAVSVGVLFGNGTEVWMGSDYPELIPNGSTVHNAMSETYPAGVSWRAAKSAPHWVDAVKKVSE